MEYYEFYCRVCKVHFHSNKYRIIKRASGPYYAVYCPLCGTLIHNYKLRKEEEK